jgi:NRE family putative nickel resistance protein-like MFS transporter
MLTTSETEQKPTSYSSLVRSNTNFRWLWSGQIVSLLGDWFNMIASVALVASLTESGLAVGGLFVLRMLAPFVTSPFAGVLADRYSRRSILIASDIARGFIVLGMLIVRSADLLWLLYVLTALQLGTSSFFFTARTAILPDIVDPRALAAANAITSATWSVMLAIGAALGGFTAGWLGVHAAFTIDAATFFISALLVARIRSAPPIESRKPPVSGIFGQYSEGLRYLTNHPDILTIALHKTALTIFFGTTFRVVQAAVADRVFPLGQQSGISMGLMFAAAGVGTGVGPLTVRYFLGDTERRLRWAIVGGYLVGGLGLVVSAQLSNLEMMIVGAFLTGLGNGVLWVFSSQLLLQLVDATVRGRVFSTEFAMFTLSSAVGSAAVGAAIDTRLGISGVLTAMAIMSLLPAIAWSLWLATRRRGN